MRADAAACATRRLWLAAPASALPALAELREAWREIGIDVQVQTSSALPDLAAQVAAAAAPPDAALLVGPARRAPARVLPAALASARNAQRVPLAWLPMRDEASLSRFAHHAARVHRRRAVRGGVALLGQWTPQYLQVAERMRRLAHDGGLRAFAWTSDGLTREAMVSALGCGLGLGLYVGHGRPVGWAGYHGVRAHHFAAWAAAGERSGRARPPEPMGALLSLCCRTASRRRVGLSYAEALSLQGVAAATLGAVGDTLHSDNTRWAVGLCQALTEGAADVGTLLARAAPLSPAAIRGYRLIGDPFAPIGSDEPALHRAARVRTFA